jgi:hypothetical protein
MKLIEQKIEYEICSISTDSRHTYGYKLLVDLFPYSYEADFGGDHAAHMFFIIIYLCVLSCCVSLRSGFRVVMSIAISAWEQCSV